MPYKVLMMLSASGFAGYLGLWVLPLMAAGFVVGMVMDRTAPKGR